MKRVRIGQGLLLLIIMLLLSTMVCAWTTPKPTENFFYYDDAGILDGQTKDHIMEMGPKLEEKTGAQVVVVILENLGGLDEESAARQIFDAWGIGDKEKNNGVLLIIGMKEQRMRIEVGYGLEGAITDGMSGRIIRELIAPEFKAEKYSRGIYKAYDQLVYTITKEYGLDLEGLNQPLPKKRIDSESLARIIAIICFIIYITIFRKRAGRGGGGSSGRYYRGGGGGYSGGGGYFGGGGSSGGGGASGGW